MTEKVEVHCTKPLEVTRFRKPAEYCLIEFKLLLQFTQAGHVTYSQVPNTSNGPNRSNGGLFGQKLIIVTPK